MLLDLPEVPEMPEMREIPGYDASKFISMMGAFNKAAGRGKTFDPNSVADLKQAMMIAVMSYRILNRYYSSVNDRIKSDRLNSALRELLSNPDCDDEGDANSEDENAEDFGAATWEDVLAALEEIQAFNKAYADNLAKTLTAFEQLAETYSGYLSMLLKVILTSPNDIQRDILGNAYFIGPDIIDDTLKELLVAVDDREPYDSIDDRLKAFIETLNEKWAHLALP